MFYSLGIILLCLFTIVVDFVVIKIVSEFPTPKKRVSVLLWAYLCTSVCPLRPKANFSLRIISAFSVRISLYYFLFLMLNFSGFTRRKMIKKRNLLKNENIKRLYVKGCLHAYTSPFILNITTITAYPAYTWRSTLPRHICLRVPFHSLFSHERPGRRHNYRAFSFPRPRLRFFPSLISRKNIMLQKKRYRGRERESDWKKIQRELNRHGVLFSCVCLNCYRLQNGLF